MTHERADPSPSPRRRALLVLGAVGCVAVLPVLLVALFLLATPAARGPDLGPFVAAVGLALGPPPPTFTGGLATLGTPASFQDNFEVEAQDLPRMLEALAPLGAPPYLITAIGHTDEVVGDPPRPTARSVRCRVQGARATREVTFEFEAHEVTLAMWWTLRRATLHERPAPIQPPAESTPR